MLVTLNCAGDIRLTVGECPIWRYMDYAKFASSIKRESGFGLWFSPIRDLASSDPYEGTLSSETSRNVSDKIAEFLIPFVKSTSSEDPKVRRINGVVVDPTCDESLAAFVAGMVLPLLSDMSQHASHKAVNCWHKNETESIAMWSLYCQSEYGVVIESTVGRLHDVVQSAEPKSECITAGSVQYKDQRATINQSEDVNSFFFRKQPQFRHENEFRLVKGIIRSPDSPLSSDGGFFVDVNFSQLAISVRVHPQSPPWFFDLVKQDVASALHPVCVRCSELLVKPIPLEELISPAACKAHAIDAVRRLSGPPGRGSQPPEAD